MVITNANSVRRMVNSDQLTETVLAEAITAGDNQVKSITGVEDWEPTDPAYGLLSEIGAAYAAWSILIGWDPNRYLERAKEVFKTYQQNVSDFRKLPLPETKTESEFEVEINDSPNPYVNDEVPHFLSKY